MSMAELYDRRLQEIRELRAAITANDAHLQKVEALNSALLAALKTARRAFESDEHFYSNVTKQVDEAIAKAERRTPMNARPQPPVDIHEFVEPFVDECKRLRELNAELLAALKSVIRLSQEENLDYFDEDRARRLVAKAEGRK